MKILITSGGQLGLEVAKLLQGEHDVIVCDRDVACLSAFAGIQVVPVSGMEAPGYLDELNLIVQQHQIGLVIPTYDAVAIATMLTLPTYQPSIDALKICYSKILTNRTLAPYVPVPKLISVPTAQELPYFTKPDIGFGSEGARMVTTLDQAWQAVQSGRCLQEYIPGQLVTVDCLFDRQHRLVAAGFRKCLKQINGVTVHAVTFYSKALHQIVCRVGKVLRLQGIVNIDAIARNDEFVVIEVNARVSTGMDLSAIAGVNLPKLLVRLAQEHQCLTGIAQPGVIAKRIWTSLYATANSQRQHGTENATSAVHTPRR